MTDARFQIGADGMDVSRIVSGIRETVRSKMETGAYAGAQLACAERFNLQNLKRDENFFEFYLESLREAVTVDINDFDIRERRRGAGTLLVALKKIIWALLKFYTYRLWSQQNQVNGLLLSATEEIDRKYRDRVKAIEDRLAKMESRMPS